MKKIIIVLLGIFLVFASTACENKEEVQHEEKNNIKEEKKETNNNEKKEESNKINIDDDEIIEFDDEENKAPESGNVTVEKVINCDGCVFSYFSEEKHIGSTLTENEYTKDINNLKTQGGKQRHNFFGFILDGNKISKAYSCILKDNKIYCIEGSVDGSHHSNNIGILNQIFTAAKCKTISDGNTYTCTDGSYNGDSKTSGYTSLHYETSCTIYGSNAKPGTLVCH